MFTRAQADLVGAEKGTEQLDVARFPQTESIAELIEQPVFNLFYPFGLPLDQLRLEDYH